MCSPYFSFVTYFVHWVFSMFCWTTLLIECYSVIIGCSSLEQRPECYIPLSKKNLPGENELGSSNVKLEGRGDWHVGPTTHGPPASDHVREQFTLENPVPLKIWPRQGHDCFKLLGKLLLQIIDLIIGINQIF